MTRIRLAAFPAAALLLGTSACGGNAKTDAVQPSLANVDSSAPQKVYAMPNGFPNVVTKCDDWGHRIYVTSHTDSRAANLVVIADRSCQK